jgi:hypothetical protein
MSGLSAGRLGSILPLLSNYVTPASLALPDSFHRAPTCARTEALFGRPLLLNESLIATGPVATVVEKSF